MRTALAILALLLTGGLAGAHGGRLEERTYLASDNVTWCGISTPDIALPTISAACFSLERGETTYTITVADALTDAVGGTIHVAYSFVGGGWGATLFGFCERADSWVEWDEGIESIEIEVRLYPSASCGNPTAGTIQLETHRHD